MNQNKKVRDKALILYNDKLFLPHKYATISTLSHKQGQNDDTDYQITQLEGLKCINVLSSSHIFLF